MPLPVQLPEILLEPATNPMPPKRSKTNRKAWKRPKSTKLGLFTEDLCVCPLEGEGVLFLVSYFLFLVCFLIVIVAVAVVSMTVGVKSRDASR